MIGVPVPLILNSYVEQGVSRRLKKSIPRQVGNITKSLFHRFPMKLKVAIFLKPLHRILVMSRSFWVKVQRKQVFVINICYFDILLKVCINTHVDFPDPLIACCLVFQSAISNIDSKFLVFHSRFFDR